LPLFSFSYFYAVAVVVEGSKSQQVQVWASLKAPLPIHRPKGELAGLKWRDMGASWASPIPAKSYCLRLPVRCSEEDPTIIKDMPKPLLQPPSPHPSLKVQPHNLRGFMGWLVVEAVMRLPWIIESCLFYLQLFLPHHHQQQLNVIWKFYRVAPRLLWLVEVRRKPKTTSNSNPLSDHQQERQEKL